MVLGVPVVGSDAIGLREVLRHAVACPAGRGRSETGVGHRGDNRGRPQPAGLEEFMPQAGSRFDNCASPESCGRFTTPLPDDRRRKVQIPTHDYGQILPEKLTNQDRAVCPVCRETRPCDVAETFAEGRFLRCLSCGVHFADVPCAKLTAFYQEIWADGSSSCEPYSEKRRATENSASLRRLLREIPRYRWALSRIRRLPPASRVLNVGVGKALAVGRGRRAMGPRLRILGRRCCAGQRAGW